MDTPPPPSQSPSFLEPRPSDLNGYCIDYLAQYGLIPRIPCVRSSDFRLISNDPLRYLLTRRFSLGFPSRHSKLMRCGSWFHDIATLDFPLPQIEAKVDQPQVGSPLPFPTAAQNDAFYELLSQRLTELTTFLRITSGGNPDLIEKALLAERKAAHAAFAWYTAASNIPYREPRSGATLPSFRHLLAHPNVRLLGVEEEFEVPGPRNTTLVARFDGLWLNIKTGAIRILDYKTTSHDPLYRLSFCPIEFQPAFYLYIAQQALRYGLLHARFSDLPRDCRILGMDHIAIRTPSLTFGLEDRHCETHNHTLLSGPRKGTVEVRREYFGDPDPVIYTSRIYEHMTGTGRYADLAPARGASPAINSSFTSTSLFEGPYGDLFQKRLQHLTTYATCDPYPSNFSPPDKIPDDENDPFNPFYTCSPYDWPSILSGSPIGILPPDAADRRVVKKPATST